MSVFITNIIIPIIAFLGIAGYMALYWERSKAGEFSSCIMIYFVIIGVLGGVTEWILFGSFLKLLPKAFVSPLIYCIFAVIFCGNIFLIKIISKRFNWLKASFSSFIKDKRLYLVLFIFCLYGLSSLAPPTDADSLDYHIGTPKLFMENLSMLDRSDWVSSHVVGVGEYFNALGLSIGSENFGAIAQFVSLGLILLYAALKTRNACNKYVILLAIAASPVLLFMINTQKYQLAPAVALAIAFTSTYFDSGRRNGMLAVALSIFAISCKISYIISGSLIILFILYVQKTHIDRLYCIFAAIFCYMLFLLPINAFNYLNYGDPVSPLLNYYARLGGDAPIGKFYDVFMRNYNDHVFPFPINLFLPGSINTVSTSLGLGMFFVFMVFNKENIRQKHVIFLIFLAIPLIIFSQNGNARFWIEWFLSAVILSAAFRAEKINRYLSMALSLQGLLMIPFVLFGAQMFIGSLSSNLRDYVMSNYAYGYNITKEIDDYIPREKVVIGATRSNYLYKSKFMAQDRIYTTNFDDPEELDLFLKNLKKYNVEYVVCEEFQKKELYDKIGLPLYKINKAPIIIQDEFRNPFNRREPRSFDVYKILR